jgi:transposase
MIRLAFTPEDIAALEYERYHHPHPKVQKKMEVVYLKSQGLPHHVIRHLCHISKTTLTTYLRDYQAGGIERLKELHYQGQPSALSAHSATLETYFRQHPPQTITEAQDVIHKLTGIKRSPTQIRIFLRRLGMRCRKVGYIPGKATTPEKQAEQAAFQTNELEPRLEEVRSGQRTLFL